MAAPLFPPLPPELETGPVTVQMSRPNQFGGRVIEHAGDPLAEAQAAAAAAARAATVPSVQAVAPLGAPAPAPAPVAPGAALTWEPVTPVRGAPGIPTGAPSLFAPQMPQPAPTVPPAAAPLPVADPAPAPRTGGGGARTPGARPDDLEALTVKAGEAGAPAIERSQEAKAAGADASAAALEDLRVQQQMDAQEQRDVQERNRAHAEELDRRDAENIKRARDATIPDFWAGAEGARVGSIVAMAMGGIAQGILGGANGAREIIDRNVDSYFHREKDKIDRLYKYAEQTGRLNEQTRMRYAQELLNLKDQHAAVQQSIVTHINAVEKNNAGNIARADTDMLKAHYAENSLKSRGEARQMEAQRLLMRDQGAAARASAAASRANAEESRAGAELKRAQAAAGGVTGHAPTGEMLKAQGFADTAATNDQIISQTPISKAGMKTIMDDLQSEAVYEKRPGVKLAAQKAGLYKTLEEKLSPQDQRALTAARQFINADLRRESGAAISQGEFQSALARYFPGVGDSPETIRQKANNRQQSIHSMQVAGGQARGGTPVAGPAPLQAAAPTGGTVTIRSAKTGETKTVPREEAQRLGAL